jgi:hypothetical protein
MGQSGPAENAQHFLRLEALRVDVDDGRQTRLSHRGRRRRQQLAGTPGDAPRLVGLGD